MSESNNMTKKLNNEKIRTKTWAVIIMASLLATILAGCTSEPSAQAQISSPVKISYLIQNPLIATTTEKTDATDFYEGKLSLSGFKDAALEKTINDRIQDVYNEVKDSGLPPYRGIKKKIPEGSELTGSSTSANLSFNYNNVASIVFYGYKTYVTPDTNGMISQNLEERYKNSQYIGIIRTLNFDLRTGKEITLKDVFTDDVDYIKILNDYISKMTMKSTVTDEESYGSEFSGAKLIAPFKGISENQRFFLFQGGLSLVLDENNPEFDTGFYPATVNIYFQELGDCIAITKRYYEDSKTPFVSTEPLLKEFMQVWSGEEVVDESNSQIGHILLFSSSRYPKSIPAEAINKIKQLADFDQAKILELDAAFVDNGQGNSSYEQYVWAAKAGPYTSVQQNINYYNNGMAEAATQSFCFDQDGREMALMDLFVSGYDYKKVVRNALEQSISQMTVNSQYSVDSLMEHLQFGLNNAEVVIYTDPIKADAFSSYSVSCTIPFKDFGCQNMTIFKD